MLDITQTVNIEEQTVSWSLRPSPPEHERHGVMCHAADSSIMTDHLRQLLRMLGYKLVCSEEKPLDAWGWTEFWAPIEGTS